MSSQEPYSRPGSEDVPGSSSQEAPAENPAENPVEDSPRAPRPWIRKPYPLVTFAIVFVLALVHASQAFLGGEASFWLFENFELERSKVWEGELWRLLTCCFLHGGWLHLACNLLGIFLFGKTIERLLGPGRYLACYFVFALLGSLTYQAFASGGPAVGASGALCGLIGVYLAGRMGRLEGDHLVLGRRFYLWLLVISSLFLFESFFVQEFLKVHIADSAHFGGLFSGVAAALFFFSRRQGPLEGGLGRKEVVAFIAVVFTLCVGVYGIAYPFRDWSWQLWRSSAAVASGDAATAAEARQQARSLGGDIAGWSIVVQAAQDGRIEEALRYWDSEPLEDPELQASAGHSIYDVVYAERGYCEEVESLLDRLIALVDTALGEKGETLSLLNQAAWYRALRGRDLGMALSFARQAHELECRNQAVLNTLGWVYFRRGETREAFKYLRAAVAGPDYLKSLCDEDGDAFDLLAFLGLDFSRFPPEYAAHYLYLALAYWELGQHENARDMIQRVHNHSYGGRLLMGHQKRLLSDLEETLGNSLRGPSGVFQGRSRPFRK